MPDINLLQDTKGGDESGKPKKPVGPKIEYSKPDNRKGIDTPLAKPSGIVLWFRSLFRKRTPTPKPSPPQQKKMKEPKFGTTAKEPEDIFANLDVPDTVLMQRRTQDAGSTAPGPAATRIVQEAAGRMTRVVPPKPQQKPVTVTAPPEPIIEGGPLRMPSAPQPPSTIEPPRVPPEPPLPPSPPPPKPAARPILQRGKLPQAKKDVQEKKPIEEFEGVNLLPEEMVTTFNPKKKLVTLGFVALAASLFVGIVDVGLVLWKDTQVRKTDEKRLEVARVVEKIKSLEAEQKQAIVFKAENEAMLLLLQRHMYWTKFLDLFERATLPEIFYPAGIQATAGGAVSLTGSAPDLQSILRQVASYQLATDLISSVAVNTISYDSKSTRYSFIIELSFNPSVYFDAPSTTQKTATEGGAQ